MTRLLVALFVVCASVLPAAQPPITIARDFSCDMTMSSEGQKMSGSIVSSEAAQRMQMDMGGMKMTVIVDFTKKKTYALMDVPQKMCMVGDLSQQQGQDPSRDPDATWKKVGSEAVNGVKTDKYEVVSKGTKGFLWVDPARKVMVRFQDEAGKNTVDFTNFKMGPQPASMFAVPADYPQMQGGGMMPPGAP